MLIFEIRGKNINLEYEAEVDNFTWALRNPSQLLYSVSMPTISASLVLHTIDDALKLVSQGDMLVVMNKERDEWLFLTIVSVTILKEKGITEIACSGASLPELKLGVGAYDMSDGLLTKMMPRVKPANIVARENDFIIDTREDLVLAYAWSGDLPAYITPITYYHSGFVNDFARYDWAIYKEGEQGAEYEVLFDDLISFDISAANPPVTDIRIRAESPVLDSWFNAKRIYRSRSFYIEGEEASAVFVSEAVPVTIEIGASSFIAYTLNGDQRLVWSDGHVLDFDLNPPLSFDSEVIGVFSDGYVRYFYDADPVDQFYIMNKYDSGYRFKAYWPDDAPVPPRIQGHEEGFTVTSKCSWGEFLWFREVFVDMNKQVAYIGIDSEGNFYGADFTDINPNHEGSYRFASASIDTTTGDLVGIYAQVFDYDAELVLFRAIVKRYEEVECQFRWTSLPEPSEGAPTLTYNDYTPIDAYDGLTRGETDIVVLVKSTKPSVIDTQIINLMGHPAPYPPVLHGEVQFVDSGIDAPLKDMLLLRLNDYIHVEGGGEVIKYHPAVMNMEGESILELSTSKLAKRFGALSGELYLNRYRKGAMYRSEYPVFVKKTSETDSVIHLLADYAMIDNELPWIKVVPGDLSVSTHLRDGEENILSLPYLTKDIEGIDLKKPDRGRIVLDIARFTTVVEKPEPTPHVLKTRDVQTLELPPLMADVSVQLSKGGEMRKMKIVGIDIQYTGFVTMRWHGILLDG